MSGRCPSPLVTSPQADAWSRGSAAREGCASRPCWSAWMSRGTSDIGTPCGLSNVFPSWLFVEMRTSATPLKLRKRLSSKNSSRVGKEENARGQASSSQGCFRRW